MIGIGYSNLSTTLNIGGILNISKPILCEPDSTLFSIIKCAAENRMLGREYTGSHQDSMNASNSTGKVYHFYADNDTEGTALLDKNNVIFAGQCWQMIRTTDTGGVKMIYNGEAENGQCLNTRGTHMGYGGYTSDYTPRYYVGTSYTYDPSTQKFSLSGNVHLIQDWSESTAPNYIGRYSCRSNYADATCSTLSIIFSYYNSSQALVTTLTQGKHYSIIGTAQFDREGNGNYYSSLGSVGYMDGNEEYSIRLRYPISESISNYRSISTSYYYADSYDYNGINPNRYTLVDPYKISSADDYSSLVGKYTLFNSSDTYFTNYVYYIAGVKDDYMFYIPLDSGNNLSYYTEDYYYGDSYVDNGNGTYSIQNATSFTNLDYASIFSNLTGKYLCKKTGDNACSTLWRVNGVSTSNGELRVFSTANNYYFSSDVVLNTSNNTYTLDSSDMVRVWDYYDSLERQKIFNHPYTFFSSSPSGYDSRIIYCISFSDNNYMYYLLSNNGYKFEEIMDDAFSNVKEKLVKMDVELWYESHLSSYNSYLEDVIYCNDRSSPNENDGWYPRKFNDDGFLYFNQYNRHIDLSCPRVNDRFSISNSNARLKYKIGLSTISEMMLLNNNNARSSGASYWTMSPARVDNVDMQTSTVNYVARDGRLGYSYVGDTSIGIRPTISLIPGIQYSSGDGSMANPYVVRMN